MTTEAETVAAPASRRARRRFLPRRRHLAVAAVATAVAAGVAWPVASWYLDSQLERARDLAADGRLDEARDAAVRYLRWRPNDDSARLVLAAILVKSADEIQSPGEEAKAIDDAIAHLDRIPDDSEHGPEARLRSARLLLLLKKKPIAAEHRLRRALDRNRNIYGAYLLLWSVLDVTRRPDEIEPIFDRVIAMCPPKDRPTYLRQWFFSQFSPATANLDLDRLFGILSPGESPTLHSTLTRFELFHETEPDVALHVANAAWVLDRANHGPEAFARLQILLPDAASTDSHVAAVRAEVAYDVGEATAFEQCIEDWPAPRTGPRYWKWRGILLEEFRQDDAGAVAAYDRALAEWPGSIDWQIMFRKANCLRRLGRVADSDAVKRKAERMEQLNRPETQTPVGRALSDLRDPAGLSAVVEFYEAIGRPRDARLWREYLDTLKGEAGPLPGSPTNRPGNTGPQILGATGRPA